MVGDKTDCEQLSKTKHNFVEMEVSRASQFNEPHCPFRCATPKVNVNINVCHMIRLLFAAGLIFDEDSLLLDIYCLSFTFPSAGNGCM